jgi:prevent-host-death family protein
MEQVNIHAAKTHLSALVDKVGKGDVVLIAKNGKPVAKLVPFAGNEDAPRVGFMKGAFTIPADFDSAYADEIAAAFGDER